MLQGTELLDLWWCGECWGEGGGSDKMAVQMINKVSVQFSLTFCEPMDCSMPDFPVLHQLLELTQTHVHWVGNAIQLSLPLNNYQTLLWQSIPPFSSSTPGTLASQRAPTPGPLHQMLLLSAVIFPPCSSQMWQLFIIFSQIICHLLKEAFPDSPLLSQPSSLQWPCITSLHFATFTKLNSKLKSFCVFAYFFSYLFPPECCVHWISNI